MLKLKFRSKGAALLALLMVCLLPLLSSCAHHGAFYFGNYSEAEALFNRGDYEKAIQKYQAYIDENPEGHLSIISQYYIARSHAALGHKEEATELYKQIIQKYPNVVWANFAETQLKEVEAMPDKKVEVPAKPEPAKEVTGTSAPVPSPVLPAEIPAEKKA